MSRYWAEETGVIPARGCMLTAPEATAHIGLALGNMITPEAERLRLGGGVCVWSDRRRPKKSKIGQEILALQ